METIRKIRLMFYRDKKAIREISRELQLSRNTVRKALRSDATVFRYERQKQTCPKLGEYQSLLTSALEHDSGRPLRERRTAQVYFEELQRTGYRGGYDSVRRFVKAWRERTRGHAGSAFIPLSFEPGEAFQFDWSHEHVELGGMPALVKVAHFRLCYSRHMFCVAYPRESMEMVLDAHSRAFEYFGGSCRRGIYDNLKAVVSRVLTGRDRVFNQLFQRFASHCLFEPQACTPAAGWEKGQVENQVNFVRRRFFTPRRKFADQEELNRWLLEQCRDLARTHKHPEFKDRTVAEVFLEEQPSLVPVPRPFDGYRETEARVSPTALVSYDRNRYSVAASAAGKTVSVRAYAGRIVVVRNGQVIGSHQRQFGRDKTVFDPWHYLPVLTKKPGALQNGAPFKDWLLPDPLAAVRAILAAHQDGDRQFVGILGAVPVHGLDAVVDACANAIKTNTVSRDVILNLLSRAHDKTPPAEDLLAIMTPVITIAPLADCNRYDRLLAGDAHGA